MLFRLLHAVGSALWHEPEQPDLEWELIVLDVPEALDNFEDGVGDEIPHWTWADMPTKAGGQGGPGWPPYTPGGPGGPGGPPPGFLGGGGWPGPGSPFGGSPQGPPGGPGGPNSVQALAHQRVAHPSGQDQAEVRLLVQAVIWDRILICLVAGVWALGPTERGLLTKHIGSYRYDGRPMELSYAGVRGLVDHRRDSGRSAGQCLPQLRFGWGQSCVVV